MPLSSLHIDERRLRARRRQEPEEVVPVAGHDVRIAMDGEGCDGRIHDVLGA